MDSKKWMEEFNPDNVIGGVINQVSAFTRIKIVKILRKNQLGLTPEELAILMRLWSEDGIRQSELIEKTLKDKTNVSKLVDRLTKKSLVEKRTLEVDQRSYSIYLTKNGADLKYIVLPDILQLVEGMSEKIPTVDIEITIRTLRTIHENLNKF